MYNINPLLLKDFYKAVHSEMLPVGITKSVSYYTPRMSRVNRWDKVVYFGMQMFIKTWLLDEFNHNFFERGEDEVVNEYERIMTNTLGPNICNFDKIRKLHQLGYLPIEIISLPEGTEVPMHVPIFGIVDKYYNITCDDTVPKRKALGNFDFRGDMGVDAALKAAAGWLLSFVNTATVPVIPFMEKMYNCNCQTDEVGFGAVSTEHFVMCSNSAKDIEDNPDEKYPYKDIDPKRERVFLKRLLTELYPNTSFSCVSDSYDYWNLVDNIIPTLKKEILAHNGCMLIRGDSGDCVKIVTDTVFKLWDIFGGTINSKGYKVLDPHVKALYGDSITVQRAEEIYKILSNNGFAASNVSLGVGSFSMHCIEEDGILKPFTRDTFSSAIKAVDATIDGHEYAIYKDPKTDRDTGQGFKKSQKGCCRVFINRNGDLDYIDGLTYQESLNNNLMKPIFKNGKFVKKEETLTGIRNRLNKNNF